MADKAGSPGPGHNSISPEMGLEFYRQMRDAQRELGEAQAKNRNVRKRAKAAGLDLGAMDAAIAIHKQDPDEVAAHFRKVAEYAAWLGSPMGTQGSMFGEPVMPSQKAQATQSEFAAQEVGYDAGRAGRDRNSHQYEPGSPLHGAWHRGWEKGQEFIANSLGGEVVKRGRKKKSGNPEDAQQEAA